MNIVSVVNGVIQMILSAFWIYNFARLYYLYNYTDILFVFKLLTWELIFLGSFGVLGMMVGLWVFLGKKKITTGYLQIVGLGIIGALTEIAMVA